MWQPGFPVVCTIAAMPSFVTDKKECPLDELKQQLARSNKFDEEDSLPSSKEKEIFKKLVSEKLDKIRKLQDSVYFNSLP